MFLKLQLRVMETSCKVIGILDLSKRARFDVNASDVMAHG